MQLPLSKYVWFDGKYVLTEKAKVPITTHGIHYGTSIFEGIRAYWNEDNLFVFRLDAHISLPLSAIILRSPRRCCLRLFFSLLGAPINKKSTMTIHKVNF